MGRRIGVVAAVALGAAMAGPVGPERAAAGDPSAATTRSGHAPASVARGEEPRAARKVVGDDDRIDVEATTRYPFSTVGKLYARFLDGSDVEATATLIGPRHAITAAHAVHDPGRGGDAFALELVLALERGEAPYGSLFGKRIHVLPKYRATLDQDHDVALIELDLAAGDEAGWLGLGVADDVGLLDWPVNTAGYPLGMSPAETMWYAGGAVRAVTERAILLGDALDASAGQDGSAVWQRGEGGERYVVGVLTRETQGRNAAVRVTHEIFGWLSAWLDGFEGPADLVAQGVATDLPFEVLPGDSGTVLVDVRNRGQRRATVTVDALLEAADGTRTRVGAAATSVRADETVRVDVPVALPDDVAVGARVVVAVVNGDRGAPESDGGNNESTGPVVYVMPEPPGDEGFWPELALPAKQRERLAPGDEARYGLDVPEPGRTLKLRLRGQRFRGSAVLVGPDGEQLPFDTRRVRRAVVKDASPGRWLVLVRNPGSARRTRRFKLTAKLR